MLIIGIIFMKNGVERSAWKYVKVDGPILASDPASKMARAIKQLDPFQSRA